MMIMNMKFVDREAELEAIGEKMASDKFELVVIYGRRRVGKTRLILEALKGTDYIYYLAVDSNNLRHFLRLASKKAPELAHVREDWESVFEFLKDRIVVIDEFPNLLKENPELISIFQRIVDVQLQGTRTKLILSGSSISMMKGKVLAYKSPLFGRRTSSIKLRPLTFLSLRGFFPSISLEELAEIYGFSDGIPYYVKRVRIPFWEWLEEELSSPDTFLKDEVDFLLKYEFSEPSTYKRILEAIAHGKNTPKEIREHSGLRHSDITPYLRNLMDVELVSREVPLTEGWSSKRGRYFLTDNFLSFWFRFIQPNLSLIEEGVFDVRSIRESYSSYMGLIFEKIVRELVVEMIKRGALKIRVSRLGRWWGKEEEIDLVVVDDSKRKALLVEAKWSKLGKREVKRVLRDLERKGDLILPEYEKEYLVVARRAEESDRVWDLRKVEKILCSTEPIRHGAR